MVERVHVRVDGDVGYVRLSRADKHNGMDAAMLKQVVLAQGTLRKTRGLRSVILHGDGPSFCAGLDVKSVLSAPFTAATLYARLFSLGRNRFQAWSMGWRELGVPVVAAIHGNCFGAGLQLALGADIRICTPDAKLSVMEAKWGLVPDMGGPTLLRELVRIDVAKELTMTGRVLSGDEAHALGLVTHVDGEPLARARALVDEIATRSPDAVAAGKFLLQQAWQGSEAEALSAERHWQRRVLGASNQRVAMSRNMGKEARPYGPRRIG